MTQSTDRNLLSCLPSRFPVFPLGGAILLPGGNLPLNIFEPRYLQMTKDAMRTDEVIGMIQPNGTTSDGQPDLYPIGCAGRITSFETTDDGRYQITLTGICRFEVVEELTVATPYRQVVASFDRWQSDLEPPTPADSLRPCLTEALRRYFTVHEISVDWDQIELAPLSGLLTSLAMICPFEASEKQALLEAPDPDQLGTTLVSLLQMGTTPSEECRARH
ncbi:MAG: LON peptidase substrate-binding domain-containing protein [Geminicoccaceae bacterium]